MFRSIIAVIFLFLTAFAAVAQQYALQPGDTLSVEVLEDPALNRNVLVLPDGRISFPFAGSVQAQGRTLAQVQANLTAALAPNFAAPPTVFVNLAQQNPAAAAAAAAGTDADDLIAVYFLGEVNSPGRLEIPEGTTLLQALAMGGGLTNFAATKRIQLRRTDTTGREIIYRFDYRAISRGAQITGATTMIDGDVLLVPQRRLFE
ncbi:polysaccharide biosynthesis/export family protein [Mangrovicoccus algicola]|uniref:Polysaccharide export protein n=1 Tax=Mangrovicoccus algicola TaxID=2771008 RepID=A0A8J6YYE5_9RHOB|nr:polysaccharide biosynthesis/export family protein [Mangrovicoccus algicola]MBE3638048.1 polysaccharide export protein [Mangrovicoccus algicola]